MHSQHFKGFPGILGGSAHILYRKQLYLTIGVMQKMSEIAVNFAVLFLNTDQRSLLESNITAQQRKKMSLFLLRMLVQRLHKFQDCPAQRLKLLPAFFKVDLLLLEPEHQGMPLLHQIGQVAVLILKNAYGRC
ncbi:hypothetical protein D3C73_1328370 [compost metagenome]